MTADYRIRPFEREDRPQVLDLLRAALGESAVLQRTPELFSWKHLDNPFGRSIMLVAEDGEGLVGFRAFMRWELSTPEGETVRCVRPVDTATHPRARRMGIFRRLTEAAVEGARSEGVDLIFNTPNPQSGAGYSKMGWREVGPIGVMVRPLRRILRRSSRLPQVAESSDWGEQEPVVRVPVGLRTPRSSEYLKWRFALHPTARYSVCHSTDGSLAVLRSNLRKGRGEMVVSDLFGERPDRAIRRAAGETDAGYLVGWASRHSPERRFLLRAGLLPVPKVRALTLYVRPLSDLLIDPTRLSSWDLTLSDLELL